MLLMSSSKELLGKQDFIIQPIFSQAAGSFCYSDLEKCLGIKQQ